MFWRLQKVGSSTILSILLSYGYRNNIIPKRKVPGFNKVCDNIKKCSQVNSSSTLSKIQNQKTNIFDSLDVGIILSHEICNLPATATHSYLPCMFTSSNCNPRNYAASSEIKELFLVREPLSRAVSVYYFWGELFKLRATKHRRVHGREMLGEEANATAYIDVVIDSGYHIQYIHTYIYICRQRNNKPCIDDDFDFAEEALFPSSSSSSSFRRQLDLLGQTGSTSPIDGRMFKYHGDENTVPPSDLAMKFASSPPYRAGMPGPSYSWSAFADNVVDALEIIRSDRMVSLVIEQLDESLVVRARMLSDIYTLFIHTYICLRSWV